MRAFAFALAASCVAAAPALAQEQVRFQGGFVISNSNGPANCPEYDPKGDRGIARFREPIPNTGNPSVTTLTLYQQNNTKGFAREGRFPTTFRPLDDTLYSGDGWGPDDSGGPSNPPDLRVLEVHRVPDTATTRRTTRFINMVVQVRGFDFMPNCLVTIDVSVAQRLE
jgi:hypothetical protein